jgi:hypothetical protein
MVTGLISFFSPVYSPMRSLSIRVLSRSSSIHWWTAAMFVVMMRVLVCSRSMTLMPTIVFPDPQGRTMVPKPVPSFLP